VSRTLAELRSTVEWAVRADKPTYADAVPVGLITQLLAERDALYDALRTVLDITSDSSPLYADVRGLIVNPGNPDPPLPEDYPVPGLTAPAERQPGELWAAEYKTFHRTDQP
jgi:hypothetical protein